MAMEHVKNALELLITMYPGHVKLFKIFRRNYMSTGDDEKRKKRDQILDELIEWNKENGLYDIPLEDILARMYTTAEAKEKEDKLIEE